MVLAWLQDEPGSDEAEPLLMEGIIGAANWSEVLQKARQHRLPVELVAALIASFGLSVVDVTRADAEAAAELWHEHGGLSLADRLCLALGLRMRLPVVTADERWEQLGQGPEVMLIR